MVAALAAACFVAGALVILFFLRRRGRRRFFRTRLRLDTVDQDYVTLESVSNFTSDGLLGRGVQQKESMIPMINTSSGGDRRPSSISQIAKNPTFSLIIDKAAHFSVKAPRSDTYHSGRETKSTEVHILILYLVLRL